MIVQYTIFSKKVSGSHQILCLDTFFNSLKVLKNTRHERSCSLTPSDLIRLSAIALLTCESENCIEGQNIINVHSSINYSIDSVSKDYKTASYKKGSGLL